MNARRRLACGAVVALVLAAVIGARAQTQTPTFRAGVNFVRVDAYPSANGRLLTDLSKADFEILEDGVPQAIDTFERVAVRAPAASGDRAEPTSVRESDEAATDPRNRLFVLFLDTYHATNDQFNRNRFGMTTESAPRLPASDVDRLNRSLRTLLNRLIGPDDLVALARPDVAATLGFTRRPDAIEDLLAQVDWQRKGTPGDFDDRETMYQWCYGVKAESPAWEMIERRRESLVLSALRRVVERLQGLRDERKAILLVSEGWPIFRPDQGLLRKMPDDSTPGKPVIGVGRGGTLGVGDRGSAGNMVDCDRDRVALSSLDSERDYQSLIDVANRSNASFYPIVPSNVIGVSGPGDFPVTGNSEHEPLFSLATATDGLPIVLQSNDWNPPGIKRLIEDLSTYYLLGYYSTNAKADGTFRKITVRVKRPGVSVRARRGYLAPTAEELRARGSQVAAGGPGGGAARGATGNTRSGAPGTPVARDVESAVTALQALRPDRVVRLSAGHVIGAAVGLWVTTELDLAAARLPEWSGGGRVTVTVTSASGAPIVSEEGSVSPAARTFVVRVPASKVPAGEYLVRARVAAQSGSLAAASDQVRVQVPVAAASRLLGDALLFRRGPFTGPAFQATADPRFRKAERVRVDVPLAAGVDLTTARLLDRKGQPLAIPVTLAQREEEGVRLTTAEVVLAPLAQGDYVIEVTARAGTREEKVLAAIRVVAT